MKHLDGLERAALIRTRKVGREKLHYLNAAPPGDIAVWLECYPGQWPARMDRLEDLIHRTQASAPTHNQT